MKLDHNGIHFIWSGTYNERDFPKKAGLTWQPVEKFWYTTDFILADRLRTVATKRALSVLAGHQQRIALSANAKSDAKIPCPVGKEYFPYQKAAIEWARGKSNILLADEMGLGKTIEAIGILNDRPSLNAVLVLCPASVKNNWRQELLAWGMHLRGVQVINGRNTIFSPQSRWVYIVNYELLHLGTTGEIIQQTIWGTVILDEAHLCKSPKAKRTKASLTLKTSSRIALTGTPIPNNVVDIFPILATLAPQTFGRNRHKFACRYSYAHLNHWGAWEYVGGRNLDELQARLRSSVMVRRLKSQVLTELPPLRRQIISLESSGSRSVVSALRQERTWGFDKAGNPKVAFDEMSEYRKELGIEKLPHAVEFIEELLGGGVERLVVFAHHREIIGRLTDEFQGSIALTGDTSPGKRVQYISEWNDKQHRLFVIQTQAGGVGVNLQHSGCTDILFVEPEWTPSDCEQAESRIHRQGVSGPVLVRYLVWRDAFEERMCLRLKEKSDVAYGALDHARVH